MKINKFKYLKDRISDFLAKQLISPKNTYIKQVLINKYKILILANETVGRQIWWNKGYEIEETKFFKHYIQEDDICFDIGANIGYFTFLFASRAKFVHAFEPNPLCYHLLQASSILNKFNNIEANQIALGNNESNVEFNIAEDSAFSLINSNTNNISKNTISVLQTSIDNYFNKNSIKKIDIMKLDVEGFEIMVIEGAKFILSNKFTRPRLIMIEICKNNLGDLLPSAINIINLLKSYGYNSRILLNGKLIPFDTNLKWNNYNMFFIE